MVKLINFFSRISIGRINTKIRVRTFFWRIECFFFDIFNLTISMNRSFIINYNRLIADICANSYFYENSYGDEIYRRFISRMEYNLIV